MNDRDMNLARAALAKQKQAGKITTAKPLSERQQESIAAAKYDHRHEKRRVLPTVTRAQD